MRKEVRKNQLEIRLVTVERMVYNYRVGLAKYERERDKLVKEIESLSRSQSKYVYPKAG